MKENYPAFALLYVLNKWIPTFETPGWVKDEIDALIPYLEKAELLLLNGKPAQFDPQKPIPLECIFSYLIIRNSKDKEAIKNYPFSPLSLERKNIFPSNAVGNFDKLCQDFLRDFERLPGGSGNSKVYTETLYYLLKKYTWCIPVSNDFRYIQLFEFLKVRAAIALSLFRFEQTASVNDLPLLLYCVDQSGIQDFLYNISSNKANKSLKGRSFYLQLLMESIIQKLTNNSVINAGMLNVLYASGGKMYFILPNILKIQEQLNVIEEEVLEQLYEVHKLELYLATGKVQFGWKNSRLIYEDENGELVTGKGIGNLWQVLSIKTRKKSNKTFRSLLGKKFDTFFMPNGEDGFDDSTGNKKACAVTGETISISDENSRNDREQYDMSWYPQKKDEENQELGESVWVTADVKRQSTLGYNLQQINYFKTFYKEKEFSEGHLKRLFDPLNLSIHHGMAGENQIKSEYEQEKELKYLNTLPSFNYAIVKKINGPKDFLPSDVHNIQEGYQSAYGFSFYGGNRQAINPEILEKKRNVRKAVKDFTQLAGLQSEEDKHTGFHRLGVLRMDVDNLGTIFREGLKNMQSFPAYATLSSQLDLFFSGYLNTIREKSKEIKNYLNIIYSGGDDIFAVGRWDIVIQFAEQVRAEFKAFVNDREAISISAGIVLVRPKFPIAKAANLAAEAEDIAKDFVRDKKQEEPDKNALCLFDVPISWDEEFEKVKILKKKLFQFYKEGYISSGFIQRMMVFQTMKDLHLKDYNKNKKPELSFLWTSAYFISRYQGKFKKLSKTAEINLFLEEVKEAFFTGLKNNGRYYDLMAVAARWAELEIRSIESENIAVNQ